EHSLLDKPSLRILGDPSAPVLTETCAFPRPTRARIAGRSCYGRRMKPPSGWARTGLLVLAAFAGGAASSHFAHATTAAASPYSPIDQLARVLVIVENQYVEPAKRDKLTEGALKGMVAELDPHSAYLPPEEFAIFQGETAGKFG